MDADPSAVISAAQVINANKSPIISALKSTKRRLTAQFNDAKRREDEEKVTLVENIAALYTELNQLNESIVDAQNQRRTISDANKRKEENEYLALYQGVLQAFQNCYAKQADERRKVLKALQTEVSEKEAILKTKQSAQIASLGPPRELLKNILSQTFLLERNLSEIEAVCGLLADVTEVEHKEFHENIVDRESADRNDIFYKEEERLIRERAVEEAKLAELRETVAREKTEKEVALASLVSQQRLLQGTSEMLINEIRQLERAYDDHEKAVAEQRFKRTAAYKLEKAKGLLNAGLINPLKVVAKTTTDAIIPKHAPPPTSEEVERRAEEKRQVREQCQAYLDGLRHGIAKIESDTQWMEQQREMVKALLHNEELSPEQLAARTREVLQRRRPLDHDEEEEEHSEGIFGTTISGNFASSRRSVSSAHSTW